MTNTKAVSLLLTRFPELPELTGETLSKDEPYYAYGLLASEIHTRQNDGRFLSAACVFIRELADSGDSDLKDILITSVLEKIAEDPKLAGRIRGQIGETAAKFLKDVEHDLFGRNV